MKSFAKARNERNKAKLAKSASVGSSVSEPTVGVSRNILASLFQKQQEKWDAMFAADFNFNQSLLQSNSAEEQRVKNNNITDLETPVIDMETNVSVNVLSNEPFLDKSSSKSALVSCASEFFLKTETLKQVESASATSDFSGFNKQRLENTPDTETKSMTSLSENTHVETFEKQMLHTTKVYHRSHRISNRLSLKRKISDSSTHDSSDSAVNVVTPKLSLDSENVSSENLDTSEKQEDEEMSYIPYYLENFMSVINEVQSDEFYADLFNEDDRQVVNSFINGIDEAAKKLYIRLFLRKLRWNRKNRIVYPQIADDLSPALELLVDCGLLMDESKMSDLAEVLECLSTPDIRSVAKTLQIKSEMTREELKNQIIAHSHRSSIKSFFTRTSSSSSNNGEKEKSCSNANSSASGNSGIQSAIMKRCKALLGHCYKIHPDRRSVFSRMMMLFGLHNTVGDDDNTDQQQQLFQMLLTQIGFLKYPKYDVRRSRKIFRDREALIRYAAAMQLESDMCHCMEKKNHSGALEINSAAKVNFVELYNNPSIIEHESSLPPFLRIYTATTIYTRIMSYGIEVLQSVKQYVAAVEQLRFLIDQGLYLGNHRGLWFDRLALNLDFHLKQPLEALDVIRVALKDELVRTGRRYNLLLRAKKICSSASMKKKQESNCLWDEFKDDSMANVPEAPTVTIIGKQLPHGKPGAPAVWFVCESDDPTTSDTAEMSVYTRVEDFALRHYADHGYPHGIHGEGSTFTTLFSFFMWDVMFMAGIDDVFYNKYQPFPLDLHSDQFYSSRCDAINNRLVQISNMTEQELCDVVRVAWETHKDEQCRTMDWEKFTDCEHAQGLVRCFTGTALAGILERMARTLRQVTGGVPDLVVWNPDTKKCKVVEVKGPGDKLSTKQMLWLDYLVKLGVDAETCYVKAATGRKFNRFSR